MTQEERTSVQFSQLAECTIKEGTKLIISLRSDGNASIAQQVEMRSGNKTMRIFLKNAIEVEPSILYAIRDALNDALIVLFQHP